MPKNNIPRGLNNNNPLNIRYSELNPWLGRKEVENKKDGSFEEFTHVYYGIRAGIILVRNYIEKGHKTVEEIIARWAPPSENKTGIYVKHVCEWSGLNPGQKINWKNPNDMIALISAMIRQEVGAWSFEWRVKVASTYITYITNVQPLHAGRYEMVMAAIESLYGGPL